MAPRLFDIRMHSGARHFADLPQTTSWYDVRDHVERLPGATLTGFVTDHVTEAWIDFTYAGYEFSINDQFGDYWFFVRDPACPDAVLLRVLTHFEHLLGDE
jgi:hypothetical protein